MEEIVVENIDGRELRVRKIDWRYYKKSELEALKIRIEENLAKTNMLLDKFK